MPRKSEYLQIRITPEQKTTLKKRAARVGQDVSTYVLTRALPPEQDRFQTLLAALGDETDRRFALAELNDWLSRLPTGRFAAAVGEAQVDPLPPLMQNYVAAMVEQAAYLKEVDPPPWAHHVPPLEEPYFATRLPGLRLHLLKAAPVPFKRRNLFVDSTVGDRV